MHVPVHVRPGASKASVGGTHDDAIVVRVVEPAHKGAATQGVLVAVARALAVPVNAVDVVLGATSRRKLLAVTIDPRRAADISARLDALRAQPAH